MILPDLNLWGYLILGILLLPYLLLSPRYNPAWLHGPNRQRPLASR